MFTFDASVPANIQIFLVPFLQPWIDRADHQLFGLETMRYGIVTFRRDPWPAVSATTVTPAGEVDVAACVAFSQTDLSVGGTMVI